MYFNSLSYLLFLPIVLVLFYCAPARKRWLVLLATSILFYSSLKAPHLLLALGVVIASTYLFAIRINACKGYRTRVLWFCAGLSINLGVMIGIRYFGHFLEFFYATLLKSDAATATTDTGIFVSIGVSFYVFQAISYLIDVFIEIEEPEKHIGYFALYMCFFAKMLQGPIERSNELLPQLRSKTSFSKDNFVAGIFLFTWGLFKKVVIADRLSLFVDTVYDDVYSYSGLQLILATYYYSLQIYYDFSGYTDMALGTGRMFGIRLTQNFNSPYTATSIADFWRRWHISLSRWILDYIFKPLQMHFRYYRDFGTAFALLVTFLVCGAWHGLSWGFIVWGFVHGCYMGISVFYKGAQKYIYREMGLEHSRLKPYWQVFVTFNLVSFSWIFFRSKSLTDASYVVTHLFSGMVETLSRMWTVEGMRYNLIFYESRREAFAGALGLLIMAFVHAAKRYRGYGTLDDFLHATPYWIKWSAYYSLILMICMFLYDSQEVFIYFQF